MMRSQRKSLSLSITTWAGTFTAPPPSTGGRFVPGARNRYQKTRSSVPTDTDPCPWQFGQSSGDPLWAFETAPRPPQVGQVCFAI